ncbi:MAG: molecular chaperone DjlA [Rhodothalassiaceae bacterium]|nr:MAG: molecular chaperone DjlA [Rhodothalassiaceae bacterium]
MDVWYALGRSVGKALKRGRRAYDRALERGGEDPASRALRGVEFTIAVIALSAKMAKADGAVTEDEVAAFRRIFRPPPEEMSRVAKAYGRAQTTTLGYEAYAARLGRLFADRPGLLEDLLDALFYIARADGRVDEKELVFLHKVARSFGFSDARFAAIRARNLGLMRDDPYAVLGLEPDAPFAEVRRRYLELVRQNHPDRLQAEGLPESFLAVANERMRQITGAYQAIERQQRGPRA